MKNRRAIFIDDDEVFSFIFSELLNDAKDASTFEFNQFTNGKDGVNYLRSSITDNCFPEFIIIDINLFDLGGELFLKIYEEEFLSMCPDTKIFILSKYNHDFDLPVQFPFVTKFIQKPVDIEDLVAMTEEILH